ncbi:MAG: hypothetical protein EOP53_01960 [Sphingobacteriales bacterium]|nr:MAG: hypothetical protein EOP53_01960 [Sphingobacteriales bacterium]
MVPAGFNAYVWSEGGNNSRTLTINKPGKYWVTGYSNSGCSATDTIFVKSGNFLMVNLGKDTAICPGESVVLKASTSGKTYQWSTGGTTPQIVVDNPGTYWLKMSNDVCEGTDTIKILQNPLPTVVLKDTVLVCGNNPAFIDIYKPGQQYLWSNGSKSGQ